MNKRITTHLNQLRSIEPDAEFAAYTRRMVLATTPPLSYAPFLRLGMGFAALLVLVVASSLFLTSPMPAISSSLNSDTLETELGALTVDVQVQEIRYQQDVDQTISSALNEIGDSQINHLNPSVLTSEHDYIESFDVELHNAEIDALLNQVIE